MKVINNKYIPHIIIIIPHIFIIFIIKVSSKTGHNVEESITELVKKVMYARYPHLKKDTNSENTVETTLDGKHIDLPKLPVECDVTADTISMRWVPESSETLFKISFYEKGFPNDYSEEVIPEESNYTFKNLRFDTEYIAVVTGYRRRTILYQESRSSGFITVRTAKPEPPEAVRGTDNGSDFVVLECTPSPFKNVVYQARYKKEDGDFVMGNSTLSPKIRVEGLDPGSKYLFQVRILPKLGRREGEWSEIVSVRTLNV